MPASCPLGDTSLLLPEMALSLCQSQCYSSGAPEQKGHHTQVGWHLDGGADGLGVQDKSQLQDFVSKQTALLEDITDTHNPDKGPLMGILMWSHMEVTTGFLV